MADRKIRIGFIGAGGMGQNAHLRNYAALPDCEVAAIAELRPLLARKVAAKYGVPRVYPDALALLAEEKALDALVAIQPFTAHGGILPAVYGAGVPVLTEKPLAGSVAVGEQLVAAAQRAGVVHVMGYHKRSDPATAWAKAEIDRLKRTGELGKFKYLRVLMPAGDWIAGGFRDLVHSDEPYPEPKGDPAAADMDAPTNERYIAFVNYYIHQVNLIRHLLGEDYGFDYADPRGVVLVGHSRGGTPVTLEMSPYETSVDWQEEALACFERGWVRLALPSPLAHNRPGRAAAYRDPKGGMPSTFEPQLPWEHAMLRQAMNFVAFVKGERPAVCEAPEGLDDLRVARGAIRLMTGK